MTFNYDSVIYDGSNVRGTGPRDITIDVVPRYYLGGVEVYPPPSFVHPGPTSGQPQPPDVESRVAVEEG